MYWPYTSNKYSSTVAMLLPPHALSFGRRTIITALLTAGTTHTLMCGKPAGHTCSLLHGELVKYRETVLRAYIHTTIQLRIVCSF